MNQLDAELRRFGARRMVRVTLALAFLLVLVSVGIATARGHKASEGWFGYAPLTPATNADGTVVEPPTNPDGSFIQPVPSFGRPDTRIDVGKSLRDALEGTGVALLFAGIALGASFVGAEFNVGSLTTQLLFEPRRERVHAAKAAAVAIGTFVFAFAVLALVGFAMYAGSELHGIVRGVDGTFALHRTWEALRIATAVAVGATLAYSVTLVVKRSSAGMMIFFFQYPLLFLLDPSKMPFGLISHYAPLRGLLAVVIDPATATGVNERAVHTIAGGVVLTAVWAVLLLVSCGVSFGRSEIR